VLVQTALAPEPRWDKDEDDTEAAARDDARVPVGAREKTVTGGNDR